MNNKAIKPKQKQICIGIHIPVEQHANLQEEARVKAAETGVRHTLSDIVRIAIKKYFAKKDK